MEVDQPGSSGSSGSNAVLATASGSVSVSLHPLVIMNISDHFTRVRMQQEDATAAPKSTYMVLYLMHTILLAH